MKTLSEKRAEAGRRRHELHPREKTATIRIHKTARDALLGSGIPDRPAFATRAIMDALKNSR